MMMMSSSYQQQQQVQQHQHQQLPQEMDLVVTVDAAVQDLSYDALVAATSSSSRSNSSTKVIIDCNNRGTQLLRCGQYDLAIPILADGLAVAKAESNRKTQQEQQQRSRAMITDIDEWFTELIVESQSKRSSTVSSLQQRHGYVYQSPIDLDIVDVMCTSSLGVQCMVLMYNMALAFHLNGLNESGVEDDVEEQICMIRNAIEMYEICYELMSTENINPGLHFIMILANNLGQSHLLMGNYEKGQQCFEHLLSIQMYVTDNTLGKKNPGQQQQQQQQRRSSRIEGLEDDHHHQQLQQQQQHEEPPITAWDGFLSNTSMLILSNCCASAA